MTKSDIINDLVKNTCFKRSEIVSIIEGFLNKIKESTLKNENVEIRGFGTFYSLEKKARKIKSPIAGKVVDVPAKTILAFKCSKVVERELNKN